MNSIVALLALSSLLAVALAGYESDDKDQHDFAHKFADQTLANPAVANAYNIVLIGGKKAGKVYAKVIKNFLVENGRSAEDAEKVANTIGAILTKSYDHITPSTKAVLVGYSMAAALKANGKLDSTKISELAMEAAQDYDSVLKGKDISSPKAKARGIIESYDKFLHRFGLSYAKLAEGLAADTKKIFV